MEVIEKYGNNMWEIIGKWGNMWEVSGKWEKVWEVVLKWENGWELIGKTVTLYSVYAVLRFFYGSFVPSVLRRSVNFKEMGAWAVITGATDGIGKEFALELAKRGLNVVIISRSIDKLKKVAAEIKNLHKVEVKFIAADFTRDDIYENIEKELEDLEIGTLINNVGMNSQYPDYLHKLDPGTHKNIMMCNVFSVIMMTKIVMAGMIKRKKGVMINIASLSSIIPYIYYSLYSSTKGFVLQFSKCMEYELRGQGIIVQCLVPSFINTKLIANMHDPASFITATPKAIVQASLKTTGNEKVTAVNFMHKLQHLTILITPTFVSEIYSYLKNNSKRLSNTKTKEIKRE